FPSLSRPGPGGPGSRPPAAPPLPRSAARRDGDRRRGLEPSRDPRAQRRGTLVVSSAVVVGAGVFGASTARELALRGWDVTLIEQYAPGTVRSASGGDTRLSRAAHG